jgi:hypothetical protein
MLGSGSVLETAAVGPEMRLDSAAGGRRAGVAELADALDLGSSDENRGGSNPSARTTAAIGAELT